MTTASQTLFDRARIDALVQAISDELEGDWRLIGGALVALWLEPGRTTQDIDLIGMRGEPSERYALLDFASRSGLPIESINSPADFFGAGPRCSLPSSHSPPDGLQFAVNC